MSADTQALLQDRAAEIARQGCRQPYLRIQHPCSSTHLDTLCQTPELHTYAARNKTASLSATRLCK